MNKKAATRPMVALEELQRSTAQVGESASSLCGRRKSFLKEKKNLSKVLHKPPREHNRGVVLHQGSSSKCSSR